jgi:hypothetical protein
MIISRKTKAGKNRYGVRIDRAGKQDWIGTFATIAEARQAEAKARLERKTTRMSWCWMSGSSSTRPRGSSAAVPPWIRKMSRRSFHRSLKGCSVN